jgi:CheY-like chemotaxis protein
MSRSGEEATLENDRTLSPKRLLVIEDSDGKWKDIKSALENVCVRAPEIVRAATMVEANERLGEGGWDLLLLDISMNIRGSSAGPGAGGHDTTGGLKIAQRMYYLEQDVPTIIVTAFDAFPSDSKRGAVLGLEDVTNQASQLLGELLIGWVRYGDPNWQDRLRPLVEKVICT